MSIKLLKVGNSFNVPQKQYICDTEQERDDLKAYFGDLALVIETGLTYILNSEGIWMDYPLGGGEGNVDTTMIAEDFSIEKSYDQNDLVIYDGTLYRATTAITPGEFTPSTWAETNLAAEIEARGGAAAVHPDWNENNEQSPNYIQNRTHYTGLLSNLVNPEWDGDVTSELAPELTRLTPMEQYRLKQAWFYKLTDSLETDLTLDGIQLACKGNADLGQGDPITFSNFGSFKDFLYMIATNFYQLFEVESPQLAYEFLLSLITESKLEDNQTYPFSNATSDQLVTIGRMCGEMFGAYFLVKVKQDGEYTVSNESGTNVITLNLTRGWYAIGTQLYSDGLTIETYPVKYESIVPLDSKYTPTIINTKFADMSAQVAKIAPLEIELRSTEIPDFEANHYYFEGALIYHNLAYYSKKVDGQSGEEFNSDDWDTPADQGIIGAGKYYLYAIPYIKGYTSKRAWYSDFEQAYRESRSVQFFLDGLFSYEFLCSAKEYGYYTKQGQITYYVEYKMDMVDGGQTLIFHVESTYHDDTKAPNIKYTPYVNAAAYNVSPYTIYPSTRAEMAASMYDDKRLLAIRKDLLASSPKSLIIAQSGESASGDPWAIALEKDGIVQYTFHSDSDATKTTLLSLSSSATTGQILKKNQYGYFGPGDIIYYGSAAPTDTQQIWVDDSVSPNIVKIYNGSAWRAIETPNIMFCELTESNNVYTCDTQPSVIHEAFHAGTQVYINYIGALVPVTNTAYNSQERKYYINATLTTVVGEELLGRRIAFDGTDWSVDFNDSFIVRGAGSLSNIGKYLKATANGVEWDTPAGGGNGNASALEPEEMLELLMDPELNIGGSENEPMANVYGVEENGEMVALGYTETVNNVSTDYILVF